MSISSLSTAASTNGVLDSLNLTLLANTNAQQAEVLQLLAQSSGTVVNTTA